MIMINTYDPTPSRQQGSPSSIMKTTIWILSLIFVAQIIGTCFVGVYFFKKVDKMEEEISLHEDFLFLRRIQKCKKGENPETTLLNCTKVVSLFRSLMEEVTDSHILGLKPAMMKGDNTQPSPAPHVGETPKCTTKGNTEIEKLPIAIHLVGNNSTRTKVLQWMLKGHAQMRHQITYTNGYLQVDVPGVYYVYSQVSFCLHTIQSSRAPFLQYIFLRRQHETDKLLLKGANAQYSQTGDCALHSIQQGAVFTFNKNDLLFVNVTDMSLINYSPGLTYFGMFRL